MKPPYQYMNERQWICFLYRYVLTLERDKTWKGEFRTLNELQIAFPVAYKPDFAFVQETDSFWYWSQTLGQWVNQDITSSDYELLTPEQRESIPYIIVP